MNEKTEKMVFASGRIGKQILTELPEPSMEIIPKEIKENEKEPSIQEKAMRRFAVEE